MNNFVDIYFGWIFVMVCIIGVTLGIYACLHMDKERVIQEFMESKCDNVEYGGRNVFICG